MWVHNRAVQDSVNVEHSCGLVQLVLDLQVDHAQLTVLHCPSIVRCFQDKIFQLEATFDPRGISMTALKMLGASLPARAHQGFDMVGASKRIF